jgi:hypothetical protein
MNITPGTAKPDNGKGKQREDPISNIQTPSPNDPSSPAKLDSNENRAFWKSLMRARVKDSKKTPLRKTQDSSPKIVDVYAVRVPKVSSNS